MDLQFKDALQIVLHIIWAGSCVSMLHSKGHNNGSVLWLPNGDVYKRSLVLHHTSIAHSCSAIHRSINIALMMFRWCTHEWSKWYPYVDQSIVYNCVVNIMLCIVYSQKLEVVLVNSYTTCCPAYLHIIHWSAWYFTYCSGHVNVIHTRPNVH